MRMISYKNNIYTFFLAFLFACLLSACSNLPEKVIVTPTVLLAEDPLAAKDQSDDERLQIVKPKSYIPGLTGSWQDEIGQRAAMTVELNIDGSHSFHVGWSNTAFETSFWDIKGTFDDTGKLEYSNGSFYTKSYDATGDDAKFPVFTTTGSFSYEDGKLRWIDSKTGRECLFSKMP